MAPDDTTKPGAHWPVPANCPGCGIALREVRAVAAVGDLTISLYGDCWWQGKFVPLTPNELRLVHAMASSPGVWFDRDALLKVSGSKASSGRMTDMALSRIRAKFRAVDPGFNRIGSGRGRDRRGYRWQVTPCHPAAKQP